MADMRSCVKTGCRWPAAATLSYRYATAQVWLTDLDDDDHPATHDLCPHHADTMKVPRGWSLVDTRGPMEARKEPSAAEIAERATALRSDVAQMLHRVQTERAPARPPSRYDALLETLPTYPAEDAELEDVAAAAAEDGDHTHEDVVAAVPSGASAPETVGSSPRVSESHPSAGGPPPPAGTVRSRSRALAPMIRERVADMAGTVVGSIQIDLTDRSVMAGRDDPGGEADEDMAGLDDDLVTADAPGPRQTSLLDDQDAVVLPMRTRVRQDSTVE